MPEKFKYAPGKPGFGSKGNDGEPGNQGFAMYFTDLDPVTQSTLINVRIENNNALWSGQTTALPNGRNYITGDLFFDSEGRTYEIDAESNTFTYKFASLNMGGFFLPLEISSSDGFERYFNSNTSPKYIIDNVYTSTGSINYTQVPSSIYGLSPINFTRIEYTNIKPNSGNYYPFTIYSSEPAGGTNTKALALVYDDVNSMFRLGNLDDTGNIRNTNLIFDVSVLKHTKQVGVNTFSSTTPAGAILTNYEMAANSLFDSNFESNPATFIATLGTTNASIYWVLSDFVNGDTTVTGDLYFFQAMNSFNASTFRIDSSALRPLVFADLDASGMVSITGLNASLNYSCYVKLFQNGWSRNTTIKNLTKGVLTVTPSSFVRNSSSADTSIGFDIRSNMVWNASIYSNPENFMTFNYSVSTGDPIFDGSIYFNISANTSTNARIGKIRVTLLEEPTTYKDVSIYQPRGVIGPELILNQTSLSFDYLGDAWTTATVNVSSNVAWTMTNYEAWTNPTATSGNAGSTNVTFNVESNNIYGMPARYSYGITFTGLNATPKYLNISQDEGPYITLYDSGYNAFGYDRFACNGSGQYYITLDVYSNVAWTCDWANGFYFRVNYGSSASGGPGGTSLTISCPYNNETGSEDYIDTLRFKIGGVTQESIQYYQLYTTCY